MSGSTSVFKLVPYSGAPAGIYDTYLLPAVVQNDFAQDLPRHVQAYLTRTQAPASLLALGEPSAAAAWKSIPSWDVVGREDKVIPPHEQLFMAHRAHAHVTEIDSSHVSLISHPGAVARNRLSSPRGGGGSGSTPCLVQQAGRSI